MRSCEVAIGFKGLMLEVVLAAPASLYVNSPP